MLRAIVARELKDHVLSLRFYVAGGLCFALSVLSAVVLVEEDARDRQEMAPYLSADAYRQVTEWATANNLMNGGFYLSRQPPALRSLAHGLSDLSLIAQIKGANHVIYLRRPLVDNPVPELLGRFDLVFLVGSLLSLVAALFVHDAIAGERERGSLRLVLSHPVSRGSLLFGKWLGAVAAVGAILVPCIAAASLIVASHPGVELSNGDRTAIACMTVGSLLYAGAFAALGLFLSVRSPDRRTALLATLSTWALLVFVVPNLAPHAARALAPAQAPRALEANVNRIRFEAERRGWDRVAEFIDGRDWGEYRWAQWDLNWGTWSDAIPRLGEELPDDESRRSLVAFAGRVMHDQYGSMERRAGQLKAEHVRRRLRQVELGRLLSCVSPLAPFTYLMTELAGTGVTGELHFRSRVERFKGELVDYLDRELAAGRMWEQVDAEDFPFFHYEDPGRATAPIAGYASLLVLFGAAFFLAAYAALVRLEV